MEYCMEPKDLYKLYVKYSAHKNTELSVINSVKKCDFTAKNVLGSLSILISMCFVVADLS